MSSNAIILKLKPAHKKPTGSGERLKAGETIIPSLSLSLSLSVFPRAYERRNKTNRSLSATRLQTLVLDDNFFTKVPSGSFPPIRDAKRVEQPLVSSEYFIGTC